MWTKLQQVQCRYMYDLDNALSDNNEDPDDGIDGLDLFPEEDDYM